MSFGGFKFEHSYAEMPDLFYSVQKPQGFRGGRMVVFNHSLAESLGLNADELAVAADFFTGTELPAEAHPIATAYAGYQFGHFAMLGDGRAILAGEHVTADGRRFDIQLKGAGQTPYSRGGDGLAALAPMLREYIISEAMERLGIPTSRSLAVAETGGFVMRERALPGAVLTRVASSHIRVGTFNFAAAYGTQGDLREFADYSIWRHFPELGGDYLAFFRQVAKLQAELIAKWMLAGFIHGVMNTDNMAISGETIDYGPCAFMDTYDPGTVFSSIDTNGRYAYKNQPGIGAWNLARLAESMLPLFDGDRSVARKLAEGEIQRYYEVFNAAWFAGMREKLGIFNEEDNDAELFAELLDEMHGYKLDYTVTFRGLSHMEIPAALSDWAEKWRGRLNRQDEGAEDAMDMMRACNPAVIPRNRRVEEALAAAEDGDLNVMHNLLDALLNPYEESEIYSLQPEPGACRYKTYCGT